MNTLGDSADPPTSETESVAAIPGAAATRRTRDRPGRGPHPRARSRSPRTAAADRRRSPTSARSPRRRRAPIDLAHLDDRRPSERRLAGSARSTSRDLDPARWKSGQDRGVDARVANTAPARSERDEPDQGEGDRRQPARARFDDRSRDRQRGSRFGVGQPRRSKGSSSARDDATRRSEPCADECRRPDRECHPGRRPRPDRRPSESRPAQNAAAAAGAVQPPIGTARFRP